MKKKTVASTLQWLRLTNGIPEAIQILKEAGCEVEGVTIVLPDEGLKPRMVSNAAFRYLTEYVGYRTREVGERIPTVEV